MRGQGDIARAEERLQVLSRRVAEMEADFEAAAARLEDRLDAEELVLRELLIRAGETDIVIEEPEPLWVPWIIDADGVAEPGFSDSTEYPTNQRIIWLLAAHRYGCVVRLVPHSDPRPLKSQRSRSHGYRWSILFGDSAPPPELHHGRPRGVVVA